MLHPTLGRCLAVLAAAGTLLGGCAAPSATTNVPQIIAPAVHATIKAQSSSLLYVTGATASWAYVYVFSFPAGAPLFKISKQVKGLCTDSKGDVFMTQSYGSTSTILEYAHGGKKPIATLTDPYSGASACAVDPTTGDLAVASGGVVVYANAQGTPQHYYIWFAPTSLTYDSTGALYALGTDENGVVVAELEKHGIFKSVQFSKQPRSPPMGIQSVGKDMVIGEGTNFYNDGSFRRYVIANRKGSLHGRGQVLCQAVSFYVAGSTMIVSTGNGVDFFNYPAGGAPTKTIDNIYSNGSQNEVVSDAP